MTENLPVKIEKPFNIVRPLVKPAEAKEMWHEYEQLKAALLDPETDVQKIKGRDFLKKSYWRKLDKCFSLSIELLRESEQYLQVLIGPNTTPEYYPLDTKIEVPANKKLRITIVFSAIYRAIAPNGVFMDGDGHCDLWEKGYPNTYHNAKATAHTRAKNRAISDLVGGGEVSAEEITQDHTSPVQPQYVDPESISGTPRINQVYDEEITKIITAFENIGIGVGQLEDILKHDLTKVSEDEIKKLRAFYKEKTKKKPKKEDEGVIIDPAYNDSIRPDLRLAMDKIGWPVERRKEWLDSHKMVHPDKMTEAQVADCLAKLGALKEYDSTKEKDVPI